MFQIEEIIIQNKDNGVLNKAWSNFYSCYFDTSYYYLCLVSQGGAFIWQKLSCPAEILLGLKPKFRLGGTG